jgi:streptomycin 6-kinase
VWLDEVPSVLEELGERWRLDWGELIQSGSRSVVIQCGAAVLKLGPEPARIAREAAALARWEPPCVPAVLAVDECRGALLLEAIEPGTPLADQSPPPAPDAVAALLAELHIEAGPSDPPVAQRVEDLFESSRKLYELEPSLVDVVSPELYERSRLFALQLAGDAVAPVLLHGDLTPVNVLDGGERGLVAIDPSPCVGDPAFDAVDLVFFGAVYPEGRVRDWCRAFAAMAALEIAERDRVVRSDLLELAAQVA